MANKKIRDVLKRLRAEGFVKARQKGDHEQWVHPVLGRTVTIAGHPSDMIDPGTWNSIQKQAGWKK